MSHIVYAGAFDNFQVANIMPKLLFTSDLHIVPDTLDGVLEALRRKVSESSPDALVISGDVSDMWRENTYGMLAEFDIPVVFCLGNHEFAYHSVEETLEKYRHDYEVASSCGVRNAHCLDVEGHFDALGIRFYGNVLWYDGSLYNGLDGMRLVRNIHDGWLDSTIIGFDALHEHSRCVGQLKAAQDGADGLKTVLVTHCVPHRKLNVFDIETPYGIPNCYSGVDNLFDSHGVHPDVALCGHTHRRVQYAHRMDSGREIRCYNSGNDYFFRTGEVLFDEIEI